MVVDVNGESKVIGLCMVAYEDKPTIYHLMEIFITYNNTSNTKCIMADKDMTERNVLAEKLP